MRLRVLLPSHVLVDEAATRILAEAENGWFCLLPRHADFVAALVPGVLLSAASGGAEALVALDHGLLVKCADEVRVTAWRGARGDDLASLRAVVEREFLVLDDRERAARSALARLKAGVVRRLVEAEARVTADRGPDPEREVAEAVGRKAERKLRARRAGRRGVWFGLGMFGLVGWRWRCPRWRARCSGCGSTRASPRGCPGR
jgi:F-type H+-transporting ATPase subunit epsilon